MTNNEALKAVAEVLSSGRTYNEIADDLEQIAGSIITDEWLTTLVIVARCFGWSVEFGELISFVDNCYAVASKNAPDKIEPFQSP